MKRRSARAVQRATMKQAKRIKMQHPSGESRYGRKAKFLRAHGGDGTQWPDKPWRGAN